jgi:hypothetical protein
MENEDTVILFINQRYEKNMLFGSNRALHDSSFFCSGKTR